VRYCTRCHGRLGAYATGERHMNIVHCVLVLRGREKAEAKSGSPPSETPAEADIAAE
jgi:hypothetical protein